MPQHISELETPALLIDLDRMTNNLQRVAEYAAEHKLNLRPHTKTHKNPIIGKMQLDLGEYISPPCVCPISGPPAPGSTLNETSASICHNPT